MADYQKKLNRDADKVRTSARVDETADKWVTDVAADDGALATIGKKADQPAGEDLAGAHSGIALWKAITAALRSIVTALAGTIGVQLASPLPAGANTIGKVDQGAAGATAWPVSLVGSNLTQALVTVPPMDFKGKVSGQTFDVPHVAKLLSFSGTPGSPTALGGAEFSAASYTGLSVQDGSSVSSSDSANGSYRAVTIAFDLLNDLKYRGFIPKTMTRDQLVAALKSLTVTWVGYGVGANGGVSTNGANVKAWNTSTSAWSGGVSHAASTPTGVALSGLSGTHVDTNGVLQVLVHSTYPSDGTIASTIYTDYIRVDVQLSAEYLLDAMVQAMGATGRMAPTQALMVGGKASDGTLREVGVVPTVADGQALALNRQATTAAQMAYNGATLDMVRVPNVFKCVVQGSVASGASATLWAPPANKKIRLMGGVFSSDNSGNSELRMGTAGAGTRVVSIYMPTGGGAVPFSLGQGRLANAVNEVVEVFNNTGAVRSYWVTLYGTEE